MNIILDERNCRKKLFPFTLTRHTAQLFTGMSTLEAKWQMLTQIPVRLQLDAADENSIFLPANVIPTSENIDLLIELAIAGKTINEQPGILFINHPWQLYQYNSELIKKEFFQYSENKNASRLNPYVTQINEQHIFIEENAEIGACILNATDGPIYISSTAKILDGACLRGPLFIGENSLVKMGAKIYGATSIGKNCMVGGEIKNSVIFDNSNKAHDGYLGDAVLGSWCNLGAGTSNSNVKNTAGEIKFTIGKNEVPVAAGNKAGLLMGDYSRAAINTRFNSGTVVGICCNIFGDVFHQKYIPNFSWNAEKYIFDKALRDINNWMQMKDTSLSEKEINNLKEIYKS